MIVLALLVIAYAVNPRLANRLFHYVVDQVMSWFPKKNPGDVKVDIGKSKDC